MSQHVIDKYIQRSITLMRAAEGDANEVSRLLDEVIERMVKNIREAQDGKPITQRQLERKIDEELKHFYLTDLPKELVLSAEAAIEAELTWNAKVIFDETAKEIIVPKKQEVVARTATKQYQGKTFQQWARSEYGTKSRQVIQTLKIGFVESKSIAEIESDVAAITGRARRDVRTIVRSSFMHNATEAKETVFGMNPELIEGAIWVSVLDNRTTPLICGVRDGLLYDEERNPVGHTLSWLDGPGRAHWNCRSISVPKLIGVPYSGNRAATEAGPEYQRGDNVTRNGRVRKNHKDARERGIFKTVRHTTRTTYEPWLRNQARHNIDFVSDILGNKRDAQLFRDGKVSLLELGLESPVARPTSRTSL